MCLYKPQQSNHLNQLQLHIVHLRHLVIGEWKGAKIRIERSKELSKTKGNLILHIVKSCFFLYSITIAAVTALVQLGTTSYCCTSILYSSSSSVRHTRNTSLEIIFIVHLRITDRVTNKQRKQLFKLFMERQVEKTMADNQEGAKRKRKRNRGRRRKPSDQVLQGQTIPQPSSSTSQEQQKQSIQQSQPSKNQRYPRPSKEKGPSSALSASSNGKGSGEPEDVSSRKIIFLGNRAKLAAQAEILADAAPFRMPYTTTG